MVKRFSQLEKNQTKRDKEISKQFANFSNARGNVSKQDSSWAGAKGEEDKKSFSSSKKSYSGLMELADDSEDYQSEEEELYDSDMG